ncbi:cytochrome c3 family protein [Erythrobacter sp. HKB08]|uniref:cytochrome c3 family protein n=1 Tax=Erythrobacter sp. HKB08 TaxID=2502843 RepID=UPI001008B989|nr:cytochrome c3 family protein [Erythrobacter sp. HKB08]
MAYLIRTIDFTSAGREIVRDREVDGDTLTIGRASESDIHLPDLAVEQNHARIEPGPGGQLKAEAVGTLGFTHDGRNRTSATFNPREGAELGFGTYRLAISQDGDEPVLIVITQVEEKAEDTDVVKGFALASALPSKRAMAWIGMIAVLVAFLAIPIYTNLTRERVEPDYDAQGATKMDASWSTGALSLAHHGLEDNCEACHVDAFVSVRDETCLTCHEEIGDHAPIPRQLTGRGPMSAGDQFLWAVAETFGKEGPGNCTTCHTEHEGEGRMEPPAQRFCAECHDGMDLRLTDTELGNAADFGLDHPQFKAVFYPNLGSDETQRLSLDDNIVEQHGLIFPHDLHMDPRGGVARMAGNIGAKRGYGEALVCADCHEPTADEVGFKPVEMEEACEACHSLVYDKVGNTFRTLRHGDVDQMRADLAAMDRAPRRPITTGRSRPGEYAQGRRYYQDFGRPMRNYIAINQALAPKGVCGECHIPTSTGGRADVMPVNLRDNYFMHGWFDHEAHKQEDCTSCHAADTSSTSQDLLLPKISGCRDCHEGEYATKAEVPSSCAMCHAYHPRPMGVPPGEKPASDRQVALISRRAE